MNKFKQYHPKLHFAVKRYSLLQYVIMLCITAYLLVNITSLSIEHQLVAVATVVAMSIQNGFILSKAKVALALEGPRLLVFPLMWVASGMGMAATLYSASSMVSLLVLANAVRHRNHRRPLNLSNEPENLV
ncbi:hypothetical protein JC525_10360 [Alteromonas sp. IB21]|uniref:hypothetical protein n=1 Tax=Alteromonas sp. IB21 TaxID=2779369 RepID=UPI0018E7FC3C|nr:hypothetical protein [Alteromonas sp. IB21]